MPSSEPIEVLRKYPAMYCSLKVVPFEGSRGFSGAEVLKLNGGPGQFCLRRWPTERPSDVRIRGLHRLLKIIADRGVSPVAVPIAAENGSTLVKSHGELWQLEPWMPGSADYWQHPSDTRLQSAMAALAAWHRAAAKFEPKADEARWFANRGDATSPAVLERLQIIKRWQSGMWRESQQTLADAASFFREMGEQILRLFGLVAPKVIQHLRAAASVGVRLQPCLRDVWHDHVLFTGDEVTGLIDPTACRSDTVATDLARLIGSFVGDDQRARQCALEEYQRHRTLTLHELGLVEVLDQSAVALSGLTWLDRYRQGRLPDDQVRQQQVIERLSRILQRLERLTATL